MTTKKVLIILSTVILILLAVVSILTVRIKKVNAEKDTQQKNVSTLLESVEMYKTQDSLTAATVGQLNLTLEQYEQYRAEDARIIETLQIDNKRLNSIITAQTESYYQDTAQLRDSIIILNKVTAQDKDSLIIDTVKMANFADTWHTLNIIINKDSVSYKLRTKESIIITNHIVPKRFLGFLWKYGVKEIRTEAVSKNPYTDKITIESITIK